MKCESCNQNIPDDSKFCPNCQSEIKTPINPGSISNPAEQQNINDTNFSQQQNTSNANEPQQPYGQAPQQPYSQAPQQPYGQTPQQPSDQAPQQPYDQIPQQPYGQAPQQPYGQAPQQPYGQAPQQPYGQAPQQPYGNAQTGSNQGYIYDNSTGNYSMSRIVTDSVGNQVRQVTYYDPRTQLYTTVNYPFVATPPPSSSNNKRIIIIICIVVGALFLFGIVKAVANEIAYQSSYSGLFDDYNPYSDYYDSSDNYDWNDDYNDYSGTDGSTIRDSSISNSSLKPFFSNRENGISNSIDSIRMSPYYNNIVEYNGLLYFCNRFDYDNAILKFDPSTNKTEILLNARGNNVESFDIIDGELIVSLSKNDSEYGQFFSINLHTYDTVYLFDEIISKINIHNGYLYLLDSTDNSIVKIGKDSYGNYISKAYSSDLDYNLITYPSYSTIDDNYLYCLSYDSVTDTELVYRISLDSYNSTLVFQGEKEYTYEDIAIDNNKIYYSKLLYNYDGEELEKTAIVVANSELGQKGSEKILLESSFSKDADFVFIKNNDNMFYTVENDGFVTIIKTDPNDLTAIIAETIVTDAPYYTANDWFVVLDDTENILLISSDDLSVTEATYDTWADNPIIDYFDLYF